MKSATLFDAQLGEELKRLRKSHKYCQKELVQKMKLNSQQQLSALEKGDKHFTDDIILLTCQIFGISVLEFLNEAKKVSQIERANGFEAFQELDQIKDSELRLAHYKKMAIESKIESVNLQLKQLGNAPFFPRVSSGKHRVYVLV